MRGHALSMQALHGGKAKHDTNDAHKRAVLLQGGLLPQASGYPAAMRATRDLRRRPLACTRGELVAHGQHTTSQYHLPAIGQQIAAKAKRDGGAERCADPAGPKNMAVDLALVSDDDDLLRDGARTIVQTAQHPDATTLSLLHTVPGIGTIRSLGLLYAIHQSNRGPPGQALAS